MIIQHHTKYFVRVLIILHPYPHQWLDSNPKNKSYGGVMRKVLDTANHVVDPIEEAFSEVPVVGPYVKGAAPIVRSGLKMATAITDRFAGNGIKHFEPSAHRYFESVWHTDRIEEEDECSDVVFYLMNISQCPDSVQNREEQYKITQEEIRRGNFIYHRMFRARVFDFMRVMYSALMKKIVNNLEVINLAWRAHNMWTAFTQMLREESTPSPSPSSSQPLDEDDSQKTLPQLKEHDIFKERYNFSDHRAIIKLEVDKLMQQKVDLETIIKALDWFCRHLNKDEAQNLQELLFALKA